MINLIGGRGFFVHPHLNITTININKVSKSIKCIVWVREKREGEEIFMCHSNKGSITTNMEVSHTNPLLNGMLVCVCECV